MSVIYLKHPIHGAKVAISDHEAEYDETHGWERFTVDEVKPKQHPLDHDGDGRPGGSLPGDESTRRRGRPRVKQEG